MHVLGSCKVALQQGRFTYRHNCVLVEILKTLKVFLSDYEVIDRERRIQFVKAGAKVP